MARIFKDARKRAYLKPAGADKPPQGAADAAASTGNPDPHAPRPGVGWADQLRRICDIDVRTCPNCGLGTLELIATILDRDFDHILAAMGRQLRAPQA
jgi:hypothetical protein